MDLWVPGIEHQPVQGAGLSVSAGNDKFVLHTTETGYGSLQFLIDHWETNWGSGLPHFIVEGSRIVQMLALNVGAYTLENAPGGADTNRSGPAIQCEVVSFSSNDWDDATYQAVGKMIGLTKKAGVNFDFNVFPRFYGANEGIVLASYSSPIRMGAQQYMDFNGVCAHQHCPENAHWDCGKKDMRRVASIAQSYFGGSTTTPPTGDQDMTTTAEVEQIVARAESRIMERLAVVESKIPPAPSDEYWMGTSEAEQRVYIVIHNVKYHVPGSTNPDPAQAKAENDARIGTLEFLGFDNRGKQDQALAALPEEAWSPALLLAQAK